MSVELLRSAAVPVVVQVDVLLKTTLVVDNVVQMASVSSVGQKRAVSWRNCRSEVARCLRQFVCLLAPYVRWSLS